MDTEIFLSKYTAYSSLGLVIGLYVCYSLVLSLSSSDEKEQWVGLKKEEWFSKFRASIRSLKGMHALVDEGHRKYSKADKVYVLNEFNAGSIHVLPPSQMANILKQPESILDTSEIHDNALQNKYTIQDPRVIHNNIHFDIVRCQLTRSLNALTVDIAEELGLAVEHLWGTDSENWKEVNLMESIIKIVSRGANRSLVGKDLCRNEGFTDNCKNYSQAVFGTSVTIKMLPTWLRPVFGHLIALPTRKYLAACFKESKPVIEYRLRMNAKMREDPDFKWDVPNDFLQWLIEETYTRDLPEERDPDLINRRLCMVNMVAIHTTTLTSATTILDLYSSDPSKGFIEGLREECTRVFAEEGKWSRAAVSKLVRMDSAVRDSMRTSTVGILSLERRVVKPGGLTLDHGIHIPKGARIAFSMESIHHDKDVYENPLSYDAFRFSRPREAYEAEIALKASQEDSSNSEHSNNPEQKQEYLKKLLEFKNKSMVSVGDDFLSFGRGKHACPGRFFASNEVKMLIAFLVTNYEIEHMPERIKDMRMMGFSIPANTTTIRVRRRAGT